MTRHVPSWARALARLSDNDAEELVFYGLCTYWNGMEAFGRQMAEPRTPEMPFAGRVPGELPRCPFCGSPGFQAPEGPFVAAIEARPEPERSAWLWQRGRQCSRGITTEEARERMIAVWREWVRSDG